MTRGQGASKGKSPIVIQVDVEDDLFEEDTEPSTALGGPQSDKVVAPSTQGEVAEGGPNIPNILGDEVRPSDGERQPVHPPVDQQTLVTLTAASTSGARCSSAVHAPLAPSGVLCESLGPLTLARLRTLSDEQIVAAVPHLSQIDETFREMVCSLLMVRLYFFFLLSLPESFMFSGDESRRCERRSSPN